MPVGPGRPKRTFSAGNPRAIARRATSTISAGGRCTADEA